MDMDYKQMKEEIRNVDRTIEALENQIPVKKVRDKCGLNFSLVEVNKERWKQASVKFGASHGSYGSSSASDDMTLELAKAVTAALIQLERTIIRRAIEILKEKRLKVAAAMAEEAGQIIALAAEITGGDSNE